MKKIIHFSALVTLLTVPLPAQADTIPAILYKIPQCTCCEGYAAYLEQNGFKVEL